MMDNKIMVKGGFETSKIYGIVLCLVLMIATLNICFAGNILGKTSYGWVEKDVYGNKSSVDTVVLIMGIHPREQKFGKAILSVLQSKSKHLSKKYVVYRVHVTKNLRSYSKGRRNGELLANKFLVPQVVKNTYPKLVIDIHENRGKFSGYRFARFLYIISKDNYTLNYAKKIIKSMPFLKIYAPRHASSPQYVTMPIAMKDHPTLIYETYKFDPYWVKLKHANQLVDTLDGMKF
jgi:hypothetical protein